MSASFERVSEYNRAYYKRRYATDEAYRAKKRQASRDRAASPGFNEKRRALASIKRADPDWRAKQIEKSRIWALTHPQRVKENQLRVKYGITLSDVSAMLEGQNNSCKICSVQFSESKKHKIDHCHKTGVVRGLLCCSCNTALGKFKDSPDTLRKAAAYVEDHRPAE